MIHLLGVKKDLDLHKRALLSIPEDCIDSILNSLKDFCEEVVIINTCNRTEIYLNSMLNKNMLIEYVFQCLNWKPEYIDFLFYCTDDKAYYHLLEVSCGFHSKILGEDQILGQVRSAHIKSNHLKLIKNDLNKLFTLALACGKEFRTSTKLYQTPVSYSSISAKLAMDKKNTDYLILGFGKMAQLTFNYLVGKIDEINSINILVRDIDKVLNNPLIKFNDYYLNTNKIKVLPLSKLQDTYPLVDTIVCCTASKTPLVKANQLSTNTLLIFDLSLPINVEVQCKELPNVTLYNLDDLQYIDNENKTIRKNIMNCHKFIIDKYFKEFKDYLILKDISPLIRSLKDKGNSVSMDHLKSFKNKKYTKDNDLLVATLLNSTSNTYINKAIELLKEECLKGNSDEIVSLIKKIFLTD